MDKDARNNQAVQQKKPLGYIVFPSGSKPISPMNDLFLNYMFNKPENSEVLKDIINIYSEEYSKQHQDQSSGHKMPYITGDVTVETQYQYIVGEKTLRSQEA